MTSQGKSKKSGGAARRSAAKKGSSKSEGLGKPRVVTMSADQMRELLAEGSSYHEEVESVFREAVAVQPDDLKFRFN